MRIMSAGPVIRKRLISYLWLRSVQFNVGVILCMSQDLFVTWKRFVVDPNGYKIGLGDTNATEGAFDLVVINIF